MTGFIQAWKLNELLFGRCTFGLCSLQHLGLCVGIGTAAAVVVLVVVVRLVPRQLMVLTW